MILVKFIYCDECSDCKNMERTICESLLALNVEYEMTKFNCETEESIDVAMEYHVEDVPACIFLNLAQTKYKAYYGPRSCQRKDVEEAVAYILA